MTHVRRVFGNCDAWAVLFLAVWPFLYFLPVTLGQGLFLGTDTLRTYFPLGVELSRALSQGQLPLWTNDIYGGFPLLADAQIGALYPINLLLYRLLPASLALPYDVLLHLAWAGCGMYALARSWKLSLAGALLAGLVFSFNGFFFTRLMHVTIILTAAWLPWLVFLHAQFAHARAKRHSAAGIWFFLLSLALAMQFLSGFPQIAFLNTLAFVVIVFCGRFLWNQSNADPTPRGILKATFDHTAWIVILLVIAGGMAAAQLLPTIELTGFSLRGSSTSESFVTSYSLPPAFLTQFVFPFSQGEPSESNNEYQAYFGFVPLILAATVLFLKRNRVTIFWLLFALIALSLALGDLNPVYLLLYRLPGFSFFRVPSRHLYLAIFAAAVLAALALDELLSRVASEVEIARWLYPFGAVIPIVISLAYTQPQQFWMQVWQFLPWLLALCVGALFWLVSTRRIARGTMAAAVIGLSLFDLASYAPAFLDTIAPIVPASNVTSLPHSLDVLGQTTDRFFADQSVFPSPPALRGSLFPNTSLLYGKSSAQAYSSLALGRHEAYLINPSPAMLNLANVRYFMVPLEPRPQTKSAAPYDPLYLDIIKNPVSIAPTRATAIEVSSFTERAVGLREGTPVGSIRVKFSDGGSTVLSLRVGIETADWDIARKDTTTSAQIAHSFPAYWRSYGRPFEGHTFLARFEIAPKGQTRDIIGVSADIQNPAAWLTFENISLIDANGAAISLARLVQKDDFSVAFLSDTVAAWENLDVLPRAFIVHHAEVAGDDVAFDQLKKQQLHPAQEILLSDGPALNVPSSTSVAHDAVKITDYESQMATLSVSTDRAGYLFFSDTWYPGWNALVDGKVVPIYRADFLFRAVPIEPGQHTVVFKYQPVSFQMGALFSVLSFIVTGIISVFIYRQYASNP